MSVINYIFSYYYSRNLEKAGEVRKTHASLFLGATCLWGSTSLMAATGALAVYSHAGLSIFSSFILAATSGVTKIGLPFLLGDKIAEKKHHEEYKLYFGFQIFMLLIVSVVLSTNAPPPPPEVMQQAVSEMNFKLNNVSHEVTEIRTLLLELMVMKKSKNQIPQKQGETPPKVLKNNKHQVPQKQGVLNLVHFVL